LSSGSDPPRVIDPDGGSEALSPALCLAAPRRRRTPNGSQTKAGRQVRVSAILLIPGTNYQTI
jgi:hypothetical protein